jgi:hypothetical protein
VVSGPLDYGPQVVVLAWPLGVAGRALAAVAGRHPALSAARQHRMDGDQAAFLEDQDLLRGDLDLDDTATRQIWDAVLVAVDRDHAVAADPALDPQDGRERDRGQGLKVRLLGTLAWAARGP